jgi:hypothetical protein
LSPCAAACLTGTAKAFTGSGGGGELVARRRASQGARFLRTLVVVRAIKKETPTPGGPGRPTQSAIGEVGGQDRARADGDLCAGSRWLERCARLSRGPPPALRSRPRRLHSEPDRHRRTRPPHEPAGQPHHTYPTRRQTSSSTRTSPISRCSASPTAGSS